MSAGWVRTRTLLRASPVGLGGLAFIQLLLGGVSWLMAVQSWHRGQPAPLSSILGLAGAQVMGNLFTGFLLGDLLPRLPGQALLRPLLRHWFRAVLGVVVVITWLAGGLPLALMLAPSAPVLAVVLPLAAVVAPLLLAMTFLTLVPARVRPWLLPVVIVGLNVAPLGLLGQAVSLDVLQPGLLVLSMGALALSAWVARRLLRRWVDTTRANPVARRWYEASGPWGMGPEAARRVVGRSLASLVMPSMPMGARTWGMIVVGMVPAGWWIARQAPQGNAVLQCLIMLWIAGSLSAAWNQGVWISPRALLVPGGLRRAGLLNQVVVQALRGHLDNQAAMPWVMGVGLALACGLQWTDGLALAAAGVGASCVTLAVALALGGRAMNDGLRLTAVNFSGALGLGLCMALGLGLLDLKLEAGPALWPWAALSWAMGLAMLAAAMVLNTRRYQRIDWRSFADKPTWAKALQ
jgi:hypothetical protein